MAPRTTEEDPQDLLQAVILVDSFETRFSPLTNSNPRCLLPLANTPIIEYTLHWLARAGVQEVFIYCSEDNKDAIEAYLMNSRWHRSEFASFRILQSVAHSIGDAMRDLDKRALLKSDFVVVYGDLVSNVALAPALAEHKKRRETDKNAIMTMLLREEARIPSHYGSARDAKIAKPVFVIDPDKQRCLQYEVVGGSRKASYIHIDKEHLSVPQLDIREDLLDCGIDICTPDVLALWSDNFDFQTPRANFLYSVLKDYELNGKTIHSHILDSGYAARVTDLNSYDALSRQVISRASYPFVPDTNLVRGQTYTYIGRNREYREHGVYLARTCEIQPRCVVGAETRIGERTVIANSVVGRRCRIGNNVKLDGAYVFDDVTIGDNATVHATALIASGSTIGAGAILEAGALISWNGNVPDGAVVQGATKHSTHHSNESDDSDGGSESDDDVSLHHSASGTSLAPATPTTPHDFLSEATASLYDSLTRGDEAANMQLELSALRLASNASEHAVRQSVAASFARYIGFLMSTQSLSAEAAAKKALPPYASLLSRTVFDKDASAKPDQVDLMLCFQAELVGKEGGDLVLLGLATELVRLDVVEAEGLEEWWEDGRSAEGAMGPVREKTGRLVEFLVGSDDEDESEEEEESDDE